MKSLHTYALLADGDYPAFPEIEKRLLAADTLLCCDGAARNLPDSRRPDAVVGDLDSLPAHLLEKFRNCTVRITEQETNDLSKCFRYLNGILAAQTEPEASVTLFGITGKREDHTLGNLSLLPDYARLLRDACVRGAIPPVKEFSAVSDFCTFVPLSDSAVWELPVGQSVSIFSFDPGLRLHAEGLAYPTDNVRFDRWWKATLNRTCTPTVRFEFSRPAPVLICLAGYRGPAPAWS